MTDPIIAWILAAGGIALAVIFHFISRAAQRRTERANREVARARSEVEELRKKETAVSETLRRRNADLEELRRKLTKTKKRVASAKQTTVDETSRLTSLESEAESSRGHLREARAEVERLKTELARASKELEAAKSKRDTPDLPSKRPAEKEDTETPRSDLRVLQRKLDTTEEKNQSLKKSVSDLKADLRKAKGRAETNNRVYLVTKGELEVARDKIRTLESQLKPSTPGVKRRKATKKRAASESAQDSLPIEQPSSDAVLNTPADKTTDSAGVQGSQREGTEVGPASTLGDNSQALARASTEISEIETETKPDSGEAAAVPLASETTAARDVPESEEEPANTTQEAPPEDRTTADETNLDDSGGQPMPGDEEEAEKKRTAESSG